MLTPVWHNLSYLRKYHYISCGQQIYFYLCINCCLPDTVTYRAANRYIYMFVNCCLPDEYFGRGFGLRSSVRVNLDYVCRALPSSPITILRWDDDPQVFRAIILVSSKATTAACVFLVSLGNAALETVRTLSIAPAYVSTDASLADTLISHSCEGSRYG